jgi:FkbM family methyltransferase
LAEGTVLESIVNELVESPPAVEADAVFVSAILARDIGHILDIGSNIGQFGSMMRARGYSGFIYSIEPQINCRTEVAHRSYLDPKWIPLLNQGAGSEMGVVDLKISENSYSSSFYEVHENHVNAAAETRQVETLSVLVNRTDNLMTPEILACVGAIKIDTQGFELEILKGLGEAFPALAVLQVELSDIPCYVGAPLHAEVDQFIVENLGFTQVAISPGFTDPHTGVIQQYDAVYCKTPRAAAGVQTPIKITGVFTSIGGPLKRPDETGRDWGLNWANSCLNTWQNFDAPVFNVSEVYRDIENVKRIATGKKPTVRELFRIIAANSLGHSIITNSDILLAPSLKERLSDLDPNALYIGNRLGVEIDPQNPAELKIGGYYRFGFDYFVVPPQLVKRINSDDAMPRFLRIGEPWWDYALPLIAIDMGVPIKNFRLEPPAALHLQHKNSSNKWFEEQGLMMLEWLAKKPGEAKGQLKILRSDAKTILADTTLSPRAKVLALYDKVTRTIGC